MLRNSTKYTYDTNGNVLTYSRDRDGDGAVDERVTQTFDTNGKIRTFNSANTESVAGRADEWLYDSNGNWLTIAMDYLPSGVDGYTDDILTATWNRNGLQLSQRLQGSSLKNSSSSQLDSMETYTHDDNGNLLNIRVAQGGSVTEETRTFDRNLDGAAFVDPRHYLGGGGSAGNTENNILTQAVGKNITRVWTYDKSGNKLTDSDYASGVSITNTYDRNNNLLTKTVGKNLSLIHISEPTRPY